MNTPYQWTKQVASHFGGTRNRMVVHWPSGFTARGEIRSQFHHVIDVAKTVLDIAGLPEPAFVNGIQQTPLHGVGMRYAFDDANAAERRETQYFETAVQPLACTTRVGPRSPAIASRGTSERRSQRSTTTCGSSMTPTPTGAKRTI